MWNALALLLVIGCGALGSLAQTLTGQSGQSSLGQMGSRSGRAFIGGITAVVVVGVLSQSAFSDAVKKLFPFTDTADAFQALILVASVALVAGCAGQTLLNRVAQQLLSGLIPRFEAMEKRVAMEGKIRDVDTKILGAVIAVRDGRFEDAIRVLQPILSDSEVPAPFRARAHGVIANAMKKIDLLDEAVSHAGMAHRLSPDNYRFLFNRACYRWMVSHDAIDEVLQDLRQSIEKGLSRNEIMGDEDLATLREHERFSELMVNATKDGFMGGGE